MNTKTVKEFLDMTDFTDIDEVDIFDIEEGTNYEYEVIEGSVEEGCIHEFGNIEITEFWIDESEGKRILNISIYGK